ncbi:MAG: DUF4129 domain-containing protein [Ilumatobacter sp.]|uniref:DUF4129 domain-containing protein n=1 Tax=Ilumatobacter sp. TaxID=1967498 RepID=UPI0026209406|nr:DUF4129 domain-containing protein [Ilumatobacter sp.]MDJ0770993.1 DUF4129 domain-containing protein [Ilumatobacter sp.]
MEHLDRGDAHDVRSTSDRVVWLIAAVVTIALTVAASSDSVRVWTNPEPAPDGPPAAVAGGDAPAPAVNEPDEGRDYPWIGTVLEILAIGLFAVFVLGGAFAASQWRPAVRAWRRARPARRRVEFAEPLPDAIESPVRVDAAAARTTLSHGPPRNAIVACWLHLEGDVADAGLPRRPSETSSEYVERVIGRSSVDPAPITELAALYREARFSVHELGDEHRERAASAFDRVVTALEPIAEVST